MCRCLSVPSFFLPGLVLVAAIFPCIVVKINHHFYQTMLAKFTFSFFLLGFICTRKFFSNCKHLFSLWVWKLARKDSCILFLALLLKEFQVKPSATFKFPGCPNDKNEFAYGISKKKKRRKKSALLFSQRLSTAVVNGIGTVLQHWLARYGRSFCHLASQCWNSTKGFKWWRTCLKIVKYCSIVMEPTLKTCIL